jgi:hypothetical protein
VQFGGVGLGFDQITLIFLWLQVLFIISMNIALGLGAQYTYLKQNYYASHFYGGSIIGLFNPIPVIQLSAELEELRININLDETCNSQDYWNTGLFLEQDTVAETQR